MAAVEIWTCEFCGVDARKAGNRWKIEHAPRCAVKPGEVQDMGPVTSVNDPDNAWFVTVEPKDTT